MKNRLRGSLAAILTAFLLTFAVVPVSAAAQPAAAVQAEQASNLVSALPSVDNFLPTAVGAKHVTSISRLSDEEVEAIADRLSEKADIYLVELKDGRRTYYIAVDFRDDDAVYLSKLVVLRAASQKLYARSEALASLVEDDPKPVLMSYSHIVGELSMHYMVYRLTSMLGGENLPGTLGNLYRASAVANLNIDEDRLAFLIPILGQLIG